MSQLAEESAECRAELPAFVAEIKPITSFFCVHFLFVPSVTSERLTISRDEPKRTGAKNAIRVSRNQQHGDVLCPIRLLRPDHLLFADGLLRANKLLHFARLLRASGLLCPTAAEG